MIEKFTYFLYLLFYKCYKVCPATSCGPCIPRMVYFDWICKKLASNSTKSLTTYMCWMLLSQMMLAAVASSVSSSVPWIGAIRVVTRGAIDVVSVIRGRSHGGAMRWWGGGSWVRSQGSKSTSTRITTITRWFAHSTRKKMMQRHERKGSWDNVALLSPFQLKMTASVRNRPLHWSINASILHFFVQR